MIIRKITENGKEYEFINNSRNTRTGFAHDTTLFIDGREYGSATAIYYNRTWESYIYQTVMKRCIDDIITEEYNRFVANFKAQNNIKRLTAEKRAEAEKEFFALAEIQDLKKVYKALDLNEYGY